MSTRIVTGTVKEGHRVASGLAKEPRFPDGTLALQIPCFAERGLDLAPYHRGTINVSIAPLTYSIGQAWKTLPSVKWSPIMPAENFSFYRCGIRTTGADAFAEGLVYWPHPSTKPEFFQDPSTLEILAPFLEDIRCGSTVELQLNPKDIEVTGQS